VKILKGWWQRKQKDSSEHSYSWTNSCIGNLLNPSPEAVQCQSGQCGVVILYIERPLEYREQYRFWTFRQRQLPFPTGYDPGQCSAWVSLRLSHPVLSKVNTRPSVNSFPPGKGIRWSHYCKWASDSFSKVHSIPSVLSFVFQSLLLRGLHNRRSQTPISDLGDLAAFLLPSLNL